MSTYNQFAGIDNRSGNDSRDRSSEQSAYEQVIGSLWQAASQVPDPELPFLEIGDLGILREIRLENSTFVAYVSPTYTGCPAVSVIEQHIAAALRLALDDAIDRELLADRPGEAAEEAGLPGKSQGKENNWQVRVERQLSPAWTTDWITQEGHSKLKANGIAPPVDPGSSTTSAAITAQLFAVPAIDCPHCGSAQTERLSEFGSTPCKSQHRCLDCHEPFDHFKCLR